jgi:hypothetical protein
MAVKASSTQFFRFLAAQSTTRVSKVRDAKRMMLAPQEDFKRIDYWKVIRDASVERISGAMSGKAYAAAAASTPDSKKVQNYEGVAAGIEAWIGTKKLQCAPLCSVTWTQSGLSVAVTPELLVSWGSSGPYVVKLYFSKDPLSKYTANPMLRLLEQTHGTHGVAAVLEAQRSRLHVGPTARPNDLDILLGTEAASFVRIWNSV